MHTSYLGELKHRSKAERGFNVALWIIQRHPHVHTQVPTQFLHLLDTELIKHLHLTFSAHPEQLNLMSYIISVPTLHA